MAAAVSEARQRPCEARPPLLPPQAARSRPRARRNRRPGFIVEQPDARETRERLNELFNQYPPSVREVLRIDPTLMYRPDYLANYPVLAAFLEQHPEIAHNPAFFVGEWRAPRRKQPPDAGVARDAAIWSSSPGVVLIVDDDHDRHHLSGSDRRSSIGAGSAPCRRRRELNTKLIDRFSSSEELLAYLQSPAGQGADRTGLSCRRPLRARCR